MNMISARRVLATPYARRLARERNLPLTAIAGSGPNGRITGDDLKRFVPPAPEPVASVAAPVATIAVVPQTPVSTAPALTISAVSAAAPAAIVTRVEFGALNALLQRIAEVRPDVTRIDVCLKAAAIALRGAPSITADRAILLLTAPDMRQRLPGLADASVSAIAAMRAKADVSGTAGLAVSFLGRPGVRSVAAKLIDGTSARLVIGAPEADGAADCLLSYDPATVSDDAAEEFLVSFRELVETPFRLLV